MPCLPVGIVMDGVATLFNPVFSPEPWIMLQVIWGSPWRLAVAIRQAVLCVSLLALVLGTRALLYCPTSFRRICGRENLPAPHWRKSGLPCILMEELYAEQR